MSSLRYRTIKNKVFFYTTCFLASLTVIPLFAIIWELIKKGYKIAICDQMEDPKKAVGIVKREVTKYFGRHAGQRYGRHYSGRNCKRNYRNITHGCPSRNYCYPYWNHGRHPPLGTPEDQIFEHHSFLDRSDSR